MSEKEEVIGTVEASTPYSRDDATLWIQSKSSRNRHFCTRCKKGEHSIGFDNPCNDTCECLCKTHYIGKNGFTRIPYGKLDNSKDYEPQKLAEDPNWINLLEKIREAKKG